MCGGDAPPVGRGKCLRTSRWARACANLRADRVDALRRDRLERSRTSRRGGCRRLGLILVESASGAQHSALDVADEVRAEDQLRPQWSQKWWAGALLKIVWRGCDHLFVAVASCHGGGCWDSSALPLAASGREVAGHSQQHLPGFEAVFIQLGTLSQQMRIHPQSRCDRHPW